MIIVDSWVPVCSELCGFIRCLLISIRYYPCILFIFFPGGLRRLQKLSILFILTKKECADKAHSFLRIMRQACFVSFL